DVAGTPFRATLSASSSIFRDAATDIASCCRAATPWRIAIANSCALPAAIVTSTAAATSTSTSVNPDDDDRGMARHDATGAPARTDPRERRLLRQRQHHREPRASAGFGLHGHAAVVGHDDLLHQRQPEARAVRARGDERTEDALGDRGIDPRAVVDDGDADDVLRGIADA